MNTLTLFQQFAPAAATYAAFALPWTAAIAMCALSIMGSRASREGRGGKWQADC
jgi:hypothetical protein